MPSRVTSVTVRVDRRTASKQGEFCLELRPFSWTYLVCLHATLVEPALANDSGHNLFHVLVRPFFLTVCGERRLVAENLHAAEMRFERHNQGRAIDLREEDILNVGKSDQVHHEIVVGTIGQDDVNLQVQLAGHLVRED
jgi:hypothetical protein